MGKECVCSNKIYFIIVGKMNILQKNFYYYNELGIALIGFFAVKNHYCGFYAIPSLKKDDKSLHTMHI